MEDKQYKKFYRKADKHLNGKIEAEHGKRNNHKMKPYFVLQYLLKNSDENHTKSAYDIMGYLEENGIVAERRSVYRDIEEINRANLILEEDYTIEDYKYHDNPMESEKRIKGAVKNLDNEFSKHQ